MLPSASEAAALSVALWLKAIVVGVAVIRTSGEELVEVEIA